jgi:hypothetical protein
MEVLLSALDREARLHPLGRIAARGQVVTLLANRMRMQDWWTRHPEILEQPVAAPWFVVGLPRSGTTFLQQLLAADPHHRTLHFWEATAPAPPPDPATVATDPRRARARRAQRVLDYLAPDANRIHPVGPDAPTECVSLLAHSFASLEFGAINHVPSHVAWCLGADWQPHYEYFRRQLQLLQWRWPGTRWNLKSPAHLLALDALHAVFRDARVVWIHRDPVAAVTSHCSLVAVLHSVGSDDVDPVAIGREWSHVWEVAIARALQARALLGDTVWDVPYGDLIADPLGTVERLYRWAGADLTPAARAGFEAYVRAHPPGATGTHRYQPSDFGLAPTALRGRFDTYVDTFGSFLGRR